MEHAFVPVPEGAGKPYPVSRGGKPVFLTDDRGPVARRLACCLSDRGFSVVLNCLSEEPVPENCRKVRIDPLDQEGLEQLLRGLGPETCVLHPAPPPLRADVALADDKLWDRAFREGPLAALQTARAAGNALRGGSLVFLGDLHAEKPTGCAFLHSLGCAAVQMLCREAALDFAPKGISCHYVQRGVMESDLSNRNSRSNLYNEPQLQYPGRRLPEAEELAGLLSFLFSGEAALLNGADLRADGGMSLYYGEQETGKRPEGPADPEVPAPFLHGDPRRPSPKGRTALITGGGKGVGAGIARVFCAAGMRVCIGWNSSRELAEKTLAEIQAMGGEAFLYRADVTDRAQLEAMAAATAERYGGIDVLVNNAALQPNLFLHEYDEETFRRVWDINIGGYWRALQACLPYLRRSRSPRVVNLSSIHGKRPTLFDPGYAMTKGAIRMFTREAALELAASHITVNAVELGGCRIEGKTGGFPFKVRRLPEIERNPGHPLGGMCDPEDAGFLALYLAGEEASNITGAGIRLDAGSMRV